MDTTVKACRASLETQGLRGENTLSDWAKAPLETAAGKTDLYSSNQSNSGLVTKSAIPLF